MNQISFGNLWPETVAVVRRHADLLWPLTAAFLFMPQLLLARYAADRAPDQLFKGEALWADSLALGLLLVVSTLGQLVMARVVAGDGTGTQTLGAELRTSALRLPAALVVFFILLILFMLAAFIPVTLAFLMGGGNAAAALAAVVAGFWLAARMGIVLPLLATDHPEPVWAISSAWRLTKGYGLRIAGMLATLMFGFLLLVIGIQGIGAAVGVISTVATGGDATEWGIGRWLFELIGAAASAVMGTFYIAFLTRLAQALKGQEAAAG